MEALKVLSLNCQKGYQSGLANFINRVLSSEKYDFLLLQEVDKKVLTFLNHPSYELFRVFNEEAGNMSQLCIMYRRTYTLSQNGFRSFALMRNDPLYGFKHRGFGILYGDFDINGASVRVGTLHLHSGIHQGIRLEELVKAKEFLQKDLGIPAIFGGDFNAGYPWEAKRLAAVLFPEFVWASKNMGATLDSRYSENVPHITNKIAILLARFGISVFLKTDHFFVDHKTAKTHHITTRVLPDRISDHSPIELTIEE